MHFFMACLAFNGSLIERACAADGLPLLAANSCSDIYMDNPNVRWDDVAELHEAKQLLKVR